MNRRFLLPLTLLLVCVVGFLAQAAFAAKEQVAWTVDPSFFERKMDRIALFMVITPSGADERVADVEEMIQAALQEQGDFVLLFPDDLKATADRGGAKDAYATLARVWQARRELDPPSLEKVMSTAAIDALVTAEVTHFEQFTVDYTTEGFSTTTVGLKVQMFDAKDSRLLWQSSMVHVAKSPPYNPANYVTSDAGGLVRQGIKGVPDPPEYAVTAQKVVTEVINTFPKQKEEKGSKKSGKQEKKDETRKDDKKDG